MKHICPCCGSVLDTTYDPGQLILAIVSHLGDRKFTARSLVDHAKDVDGPLREAIRSRSSGQLGKELGRIAEQGLRFDGYYIEVAGRNGNAIQWRVGSI